LGFADAFINGDVSAVDKDEGLMNFFMVKWEISIQLIKKLASSFKEPTWESFLSIFVFLFLFIYEMMMQVFLILANLYIYPPASEIEKRRYYPHLLA